MGVVEFIFGAFSGVAGNYVYETLKKHFGSEKLDELVVYKNKNEFDNFKRVIESAIEFNQALSQELKNLANNGSVTQNNVYGHNFNANGTQHNHFYNQKEEKEDPKKS